MRFSSILLALPFVASVFAAPISVPAVSTLEARTCPTQVSEVVSVVTELQTSIYAVAQIGPKSTQVEVEACLEAVLGAFNKCGQGLGIDVSLDLDIAVQLKVIKAIEASEADKKIVAGILTDVVKVVEGLIGGVDKKLCKLAVIAQLLKKLDCVIHNLLSIVDCLLIGVLSLVKVLLLGLGIKLDNLFGGLLYGVVGLLGGLGL